MGNDERKAFDILQENRGLQKPIIEKHHGRWIKELGDGVMASFSTVSDAVYAAIEIQEHCHVKNDFRLRIGIHLGELVFENGDVFGDGVNIASRLQAVAYPGSIYISEAVNDIVSNKKDIRTKFIREENLKNVKEPVPVYEVITTHSVELPVSVMPGHVAAPMKSIAVLPFVNLSNDPDQEYFSDGMTEEILHSLAHLKDLKVAGRTSTFQFKGKKADLEEIGEKLHVKTVLEGSIRKQGKKVRITVQLINIEDGYHLWSEKYDRQLDDIFAIQDEIALAITDKLKVTLLGGDLEKIIKVCCNSTEAYQFYMQGKYYLNRRNEESLLRAIRYFNKAIEKDPDYALPYTGIADAYNLLWEYGNITRLEAYPKAKEAVKKALELDDTLAEAHVSLASLLLFDEWNWKEAGREFKLGVELNPNYATAHHWYAEWLMYQKRFEEATTEIELAENLDPVAPAILKDRGIILYYGRKYEEALSLAKMALELYPEFAPLNRLLSLSYEALGMYEEAIGENKNWAALRANDFKSKIFLARILALMGRKDEARSIVDGLTEEEMIAGNDYRGICLVYIALGDIENAFKWLDKSFENHERSLCSLNIDPKLDPLRGDPRFKKLVKQMNF
jgi:TolB-like protein/Tfp pilus assembly protein PilF